MFELMVHFGANTGNSPRFRNNQNQCNQNNIVATQIGNGGQQELVGGTDGRIVDRLCYRCNQRGHIATFCPQSQEGQSGIGVLQVVLTQHKEGLISCLWVLLDTCSTESVCKNAKYVSNLTKCGADEVLHIATNGGSKSNYERRFFELFGLAVHYNPD